MYQNEKMYQAENHCIWGNKNIMVQIWEKYCFEFPFGLNGKLYLVYLVSCQSFRLIQKHLGQHLRMYHCRIGNLKKDQYILKY